jgi:hypothetical protein
MLYNHVKNYKIMRHLDWRNINQMMLQVKKDMNQDKLEE